MERGGERGQINNPILPLSPSLPLPLLDVNMTPPDPLHPPAHPDLQRILRLLESRESDFDSLRRLQVEWLQFQTTLHRLVHLIDGNGRPPIAERILILEEHTRRLDSVSQQIETVKLRLIGLLIGVTLSLVAALFSLTR